jgi:hypothetical protein
MIMDIKFEIIEMPDVNEARIVSELRREQIREENIKKEDLMKRKATEDLPRFIRYINKRIEEAKMNGENKVFFNYNSEDWAIKDPRCAFTFRGRANFEHAEFVNSLYEKLGFSGYVIGICRSGPSCYRDGEVYIYW